MQAVTHQNVSEFLSRAERWLLRAEVENNLVIGLAHRAATSHVADFDDACWITVEQHGELAGCAFRTPPYNLGVTAMPDAALETLRHHVGQVYASLPGVSGPSDAAKGFAERWCAQAGTSWRINFEQRIHRLIEVLPSANPPHGTLRAATIDELELATAWMSAFIEDARVRHVRVDVATTLVREGELFFWDDGEPRSMVAIGRRTPNGACLSAVYTPREYRRRGYASAAVAAASRRQLDAGKRFCCLYTDLANPTSNHIYRAVGYEPILDTLDIAFE